MISKVGSFKDPLVNKQVDEIVSKQFRANKEVTVTFPVANRATLVDVGFKVDKFLVTSKTNNINVWKDTSTNTALYLKANTAGTVTVMVWREA